MEVIHRDQRAASYEHAGERNERTGRTLFASAVCAFVGIAVPLVIRGAPLADDFNNCVSPVELGFGGFMAASWHLLGAIRPARFLEILLTGSICQSLPFGVAIIVSLIVTLAVAWQVRGLLRDLGVPQLWADVGGALWLLQPLGTEAGLWPAAFHVPLGLVLAVAAVRLYHRGRLGWAAAANLAAALSVEQIILPLPFVAWLVAAPGQRRRAAVISAVIGVLVIATFFMWPGANPRLRTGGLERLASLVDNPTFYIGYPAVGLGLHSIPLAIVWAFPWSVAVLAAAAILGWRIGPQLAAASRPVATRDQVRALTAFAAIVVLANVVVVLAVPQQGSPRVFAPTWLVLAVGGAWVGACTDWRRPRALGLCIAVFAAGAVLSLALSASVRLRSADFTARATRLIAARIPDGGRVAVCQVRRTVVEPAPRGAYAVHEFIEDWAAERALQYYTGRHATVYLAGDLWARPCPAANGVDAVIRFDELLAAPRP
jgi:hypothetical protein